MERKTVRISGGEKIDSGKYRAVVEFSGGNRYDVTVEDPFNQPGHIESNQEDRLQWYFEDYMASPFTDVKRKERAESSITFYGHQLFEGVFADPEALREWRNLFHGLDKIRLQIVSNCDAFQALHWEAIKDPNEKLPLGLTGVEFRRSSGAENQFLCFFLTLTIFLTGYLVQYVREECQAQMEQMVSRDLDLGLTGLDRELVVLYLK